ncbi:CRAL/TRIO domain containing protein, putative [Angomonas deanei]|uniref:CRAL/TRIO domain containing protein, putative n=1 Tax=Angomonas deanei TaxID=59799 RepID=A0A7G2CDV4_9TRYP|nr:CRAL/TRIO domain containing protein, putative [Angomonas deanei]
MSSTKKKERGRSTSSVKTESDHDDPREHEIVIKNMERKIREMVVAKMFPGSQENTLPCDEFITRFYERFNKNISDTERKILLFRYLKANDYNIDKAIDNLTRTAEFRRKQNLDFMAVFTSLIPLRGYNEVLICERLKLPLVNSSHVPTDDPSGLGTSMNNTYYNVSYTELYTSDSTVGTGSSPNPRRPPAAVHVHKEPPHGKAHAKTAPHDTPLPKSTDGKPEPQKWWLGRLKDAIFKSEPAGSSTGDRHADADTTSNTEPSVDEDGMFNFHGRDSGELQLGDDESEEEEFYIDTTSAARPIQHDQKNYMDALNFHSLLEPIVRSIIKYVPVSFHYWDKEGHPVLYVRLGRFEGKKLFNELLQLTPIGSKTKALILLFQTYLLEVLTQLIRVNCIKNMQDNRVRNTFVAENFATPADTILPEKKLITSCVVIIDCKGVNVKRFIYAPLLNQLPGMVTMVQKYYPEMLHRLYVVNCHPVANLSYLGIRKTIKMSTRAKFYFCQKSRTTEVLKGIIDSNLLPVYFGGKCQCEGGCVPCVDEEDATHNSETASLSSSGWSAESFSPNSVYGGGAGMARQHCTAKRVHIKARKKYRVAIPVGREEEVIWEFAVKKKRPVCFFAIFVPARGDGNVELVVAKNVFRDGAGHFISPEIGSVLFEWHNKPNRFRKIRVHFKIYHESA